MYWQEAHKPQRNAGKGGNKAAKGVDMGKVMP